MILISQGCTYEELPSPYQDALCELIDQIGETYTNERASKNGHAITGLTTSWSSILKQQGVLDEDIEIRESISTVVKYARQKIAELRADYKRCEHDTTADGIIYLNGLRGRGVIISYDPVLETNKIGAVVRCAVSEVSRTIEACTRIPGEVSDLSHAERKR